MKIDIDKLYHTNMDKIIYEYSCSCSCSDWCNSQNVLCYRLRARYTWIKKEVEKEIMKMEYLVKNH